MKNKRVYILLIITIILLLIPLIAMQYTQEVNWGVNDFIIASFLLFGFAFTIEVIFRKVKSIKNRVILGLCLLLILVLIWAELAVGIFGSPLAGN
jgi:peptidoglycan/LPS O-acetylase OafA/YrhL